ncbi:MAG: DUF2628 domain-containing protein [Hyphomicrobium sp.]
MTYTIHEPPHPAADRVDRADDLRFIKDGFSWVTALCPPLGFAMKGLWLGLAGYLAAVGVLSALLTALGTDPGWIALIVLAVSLYLGFEISTFERFMLDRAGWNPLATVTGRNIGDCERRFFESWLPDQPIITAGKSRGPISGKHGAMPFGGSISGPIGGPAGGRA